MLLVLYLMHKVLRNTSFLNLEIHGVSKHFPNAYIFELSTFSGRPQNAGEIIRKTQGFPTSTQLSSREHFSDLTLEGFQEHFRKDILESSQKWIH
ncbi:hypothetical protein CEXT_557551 [Caerostris extrusa]|uniref:Uncharacterized protein n=1 Tax=Caerostris extrusa TaxID=172846 RepID=A0AAV4PH29_CAEEX|nr:hypothetical protein CEXT_557551 [Caerostris extrusa]